MMIKKNKSNVCNILKKSICSSLFAAAAVGAVVLTGCSGGSDGGSDASADTIAPSAPSGLTATVVSYMQIDLSWSASSDAVGVTGYNIYRSETKIDTSTTTTYSDTNISAGTEYCYEVKAYDAAGNLSNASSEVCATADTAPTTSSIATTTDEEVALGAAFDGVNYLVPIGTALSSGGYSAGAQLLSQTGLKVGSLISTDCNGESALHGGVAFDGANFLSVGGDCDTFTKDIWGRFISPSGTAEANFLIASSTEEISGVIYGGGSYLVTYIKEMDDNSKAYGKIVSPSGTVGSEITISSGYAHEPSVAFDGINFLVVWTDNDNDTEVKGRFVSSTGVLGTEFTINNSSFHSDNPLSVSFDGTSYLVVWDDQIGGWPDGTWDLYGQLVDTSGTLVGDVISVSTASGHQFLPKIAFDETNYLVTWTDMRNDADKDWNCDTDEGTCWDIYGQYVSTSGSLVGSEFVINDDSDNQLGGVAGFNNGKYFVIINDGVSKNLSGELLFGDVYAEFITP